MKSIPVSRRAENDCNHRMARSTRKQRAHALASPFELVLHLFATGGRIGGRHAKNTLGERHEIRNHQPSYAPEIFASDSLRA